MDGKDKISRPDQGGEPHDLSMSNREQLSMNGVKEVLSFNENQIFLETGLGSCVIKGVNLHIQHLNLDNGRLVVNGYVNTIDYDVKGNKAKGFINKIFK